MARARPGQGAEDRPAQAALHRRPHPRLRPLLRALGLILVVPTVLKGLGTVLALGLLLCCAASPGIAVRDLPATAFGPEGMAVEHGEVLAPAPRATGRAVAGVPCRRPTLTFHIHAHLAIYVDGRLRPVPATIGLVDPTVRQTPTGAFYNAHTCYYDLHTHAQDGVIHVEAPAPRDFTLGQLFAIWGQPLGPTRVGGAVGTVRVYVDGRLVGVPPQEVRLDDRDEIQLDVGADVRPQPVDWSHF